MAPKPYTGIIPSESYGSRMSPTKRKKGNKEGEREDGERRKRKVKEKNVSNLTLAFAFSARSLLSYIPLPPPSSPSHLISSLPPLPLRVTCHDSLGIFVWLGLIVGHVVEGEGLGGRPIARREVDGYNQ